MDKLTQLKELRKKHNLTQASLAKLLKVDAGSVTNWIKGKRTIPDYIRLDMYLELSDAVVKAQVGRK